MRLLYPTLAEIQRDEYLLGLFCRCCGGDTGSLWDGSGDWVPNDGEGGVPGGKERKGMAGCETDCIGNWRDTPTLRAALNGGPRHTHLCYVYISFLLSGGWRCGGKDGRRVATQTAA